MTTKISKQSLKRIGECLYEIPKDFREDMRVAARLYGDEAILEDALEDLSVEQLVNTATLPGVVRYTLAMPDVHQGYGFPIGGVVATELPHGVISPGGVGYDINCLRGDSLVLHAWGYTRPIAEMAQDWPQATLRCQDFAAGQEACTAIVRYLSRPPSAPLYRLTTEAGDEIVATADHPFWTPDGMVELGRLAPGDRVARYPFSGVPYQPPGNAVLVDEGDIERVLGKHGKGARGNTLGQVVAQLKRCHLLPLRADSPQLPYLLKLLGYLFGDGTEYFSGGSGKGTTWFYGDKTDLEQIRADVAALGFTPSRVYTRSRHHRLRTTYKEYEFERQETAFKVVGSAFAALLAALGAPVGEKATQDYCLPRWLFAAPLWQQRLFLAAFFGAELSSPRAFVERNYNFLTPVLGLNKREGFVESGRQFLAGIGQLLAGFGVESEAPSQRMEQINADGTRSYRLRLVISSRPESLLNLWGHIGFEFHRQRQTAALVAVEYLKRKTRVVARRDEAAIQAVTLQAAGLAPQAIYAGLAGEHVNRRFLERSLYEGRLTGARIGAQFATFEEFRSQATRGLEGSGLVWATIEKIEPVDLPADGDRNVYDFTVAHQDHNFVANGFVVSNCGVRLLVSNIHRDELLPHAEAVTNAFFRGVPMGVGRGGDVKLSREQMDQILEKGAAWAVKRGYGSQDDLECTEEGGAMPGADASKVSNRAKERGKDQVGTLGSGNHFVELQEVTEIYDRAAADALGLFEGQVAVQVHSGSRGLGHQVCTDYVQLLQRAIARYGIKIPDRELVCVPFDSAEGRDYFAAMAAAANYAWANRQMLAQRVRQAFDQVLAGKLKDRALRQIYDVAHNIAKIEEYVLDGRKVKLCVHRKGATRAFGPGLREVPAAYRQIGQPVLIPGSMGTASYVLVGTNEAMATTFGSTCHGAGRVLSRAKAKRETRGEEVVQELAKKGITVRGVSQAGIAEEAPEAYKDIDRVVNVVSKAGLARKVARLRPLGVIKG